MKKVLSLIIILVVLTVFTYAETKIGIVNSQLVLKDSIGGKAFMSKLSALDKKTTGQMKVMANEIKSLEDAKPYHQCSEIYSLGQPLTGR